MPSSVQTSVVDSTPANPRILLVDDDPGICSYISQLLQRAGYEVKTFTHLEFFFDEVSPQDFSCILLDIRFTHECDGTLLYREMRKREWRTPVIFISGFATVPIAVDMMRSGALDVLLKSDVTSNPDILLQSLKNAVSLDSDQRREDVRRKKTQSLLQKLTPREIETVKWVLTGRLNKQIAPEMNISERTVIAHRVNVMKKLGLTSSVELSQFAQECGISPAQSSGPRRDACLE